MLFPFAVKEIPLLLLLQKVLFPKILFPVVPLPSILIAKLELLAMVLGANKVPIILFLEEAFMEIPPLFE